MNDDTNSSATGHASPDEVGLPGSGLVAPIKAAADDAVTVAKENVGLVIVGGLAVGLVAAALMPRSKKKKFAKRSKKVASLVSELTAAFAAQASSAASDTGSKLGDATKSIGDTVSDQAKSAKKQAGQIASGAADQLNDGGKAIARLVVKLVEKARG